MKKIILILPYFGKLPNTFNIWLQSAENNQTIDFLIATDCSIDYPLTKNIHVFNMSYEDFLARCQKHFNYKITIKKPYKICDLKPFFHRIFDDYINGYEFWGFVDCDTVLGNIRKFFTDDILSNYNHCLCLGHLQIQRINDPFYEEVLENVKAKGEYDIKHVLTHPENFCLDELPYGVPLTYWKMHQEKFYCEYTPESRPLYDELTPNYKQFVDLYNDIDYLGKYYYLYHFYGMHENIVPFWKRTVRNSKLIRRCLHFKYDNGTLYRCYWYHGKYIEEEILYCHLYRRQMSIHTSNYNSYKVLPHEFVSNNTTYPYVFWKTLPHLGGKMRLYWRRELKRLLKR